MKNAQNTKDTIRVLTDVRAVIFKKKSITALFLSGIGKERMEIHYGKTGNKHSQPLRAGRTPAS